MAFHFHNPPKYPPYPKKSYIVTINQGKTNWDWKNISKGIIAESSLDILKVILLIKNPPVDISIVFIIALYKNIKDIYFSPKKDKSTEVASYDKFKKEFYEYTDINDQKQWLSSLEELLPYMYDLKEEG